MTKLCYRTLRASGQLEENGKFAMAGSSCIEGRCMAWTPEVSITIPDFPDVFTEEKIKGIVEKMSADFGSIGITVNGNKIFIAAHCVMLESKK
jgi:hypothetical protein